MPLTFRRRGVQRVATDERSVHDVTLLDGVARAFYWQHLLDTGAMQSGSAIARAEKLHHSVVNELLRLTLLAPDIIEQFMAGKQPRRLTLMWFQRNRLMVDWHAQRQLMATFEEDV
ncbi:site-specific recombinase resolvase [Pseudomonas paraeruginosa]|uniref:site-specific recombinase resolvase n=1 Tax=Pseudomonas aeruginosa group TaxID=136841 RepID=UPI0024818D88|nr:site-specific recombinase resolvase [Pseudomonas aeruginosa]MDH7955339.1 site-specific recombinase resolvase [Pseudomonas aeruginosa]